MAMRKILVVRHEFHFPPGPDGRRFKPGEEVLDAGLMAWMTKDHPEKVIATMRDLPDDPKEENNDSGGLEASDHAG